MEKPTKRLKPYQQLLAEGMYIQQIEQKLGLPLSTDLKPNRVSPRNSRRVSLEKLELREIAADLREEAALKMRNICEGHPPLADLL